MGDFQLISRGDGFYINYERPCFSNIGQPITQVAPIYHHYIDIEEVKTFIEYKMFSNFFDYIKNILFGSSFPKNKSSSLEKILEDIIDYKDEEVIGDLVNVLFTLVCYGDIYILFDYEIYAEKISKSKIDVRINDLYDFVSNAVDLINLNNYYATNSMNYIMNSVYKETELTQKTLNYLDKKINKLIRDTNFCQSDIFSIVLVKKETGYTKIFTNSHSIEFNSYFKNLPVIINKKIEDEKTSIKFNDKIYCYEFNLKQGEEVYVTGKYKDLLDKNPMSISCVIYIY
ncbi:hypothetical protein A9501_01995 [Haemophilus sp. CCUG 66565]|uniref:hypothetical protein n=1 Tax=Haemophilus sp. CCUG 66565 TaxID=1859694 RepID=UPI000802B148|nr:hypothetical protein [Haemophilus sp. CCUG 66565]OBX86739.1 hypothetical protein A9501_01995 [Haemophilus sp. CCUG 66565]